MFLTREEPGGGVQICTPPRFFWNISATRRNLKMRFHLFLEGPIAHPMVLKSGKNSNRIPRDVTGNEGGVGGF